MKVKLYLLNQANVVLMLLALPEDRYVLHAGGAMIYADYEKALLALVVWREARGEPIKAKQAVADSIMNRVVNPKWWGRSLGEIIGKKWQYSSMAAPGDPNLIAYPLPSDHSFQECLAVAETAVAFPHRSGADSYYDTSIPPPAWAKSERFVEQIGRIRFYNTDGDHGENHQ